MTSGAGFWATVELLTGMAGINDRSGDLFNDDIEDWLEAMTIRAKMQKERAKLKNENDSDEEGVPMMYGTLVECDFSNPPVRSRLEMLMGSNIVRLTDRKYMLTLMARIRQDYEKRQQCRIEERKKNELMRTKMMILNRFIPVQDAPAEIRQYPLFQLYLYCDSIIEAKQKRRSSRQIKIAESLHRMLYPDVKSTKEDLDNEEEEIYMKKIVINGKVELIPLSAEEIAAAKRKQETKKDIENGYILTQDEYDRLHYETEAIKEFREAQTVEEMYTKAHEILGILYSYADQGYYDKKEQPDEAAPDDDRKESNANEEEVTIANESTEG